jgi:hypothetical protein
MKKSLIALVLLSSLVGCDSTRKPATVQRKPNGGQARKVSTTSDTLGAQTTIDHLSAVLGPFSVGTAEQEPQESQQPERTAKTPPPTFITYGSKKDGFSVFMPSVPIVMSSDPTNTIHARAYQSVANDGLTTYRVFFHYFEKKIFGNEPIHSYLESQLPDRLAGIDKGQLVRKTLTKFRGFDAKEFEYETSVGDAEFICKGIAFVMDGDSIAMTIVRLKNARPELSFDQFIDSFELIPLDPVLSEKEWIDRDLGIKFTPPANMSVLDRTPDGRGLVVMFSDGAGHTIGILDATAAYRGITLPEIHEKLSEMKDCGDGFYENIIPGTTLKAPTVQLLRCVSNAKRIYLIQAYAPQQTYFRYVQELKASMSTLSFIR